jgi:peroxiredoxin
MASWVERTIDIALVLASVTIIGLGIQRVHPPQIAESPRVRPSGGLNSATYKPGERLEPLNDVDFSRATRTLVVFVTSYCPYCTNSMEFYRDLSEEESRRANSFQLVIAGPESVESLKTFLTHHQLRADRVVSLVDFAGVRATPTLILTNRRGIIERIWVGEQGQAGRAAVFAAIRGGKS